MADFNTLTIAGNLTQEPELRFTPQGVAVCSLQVVTSKSVKNADGTWENKDAVYWTVNVWRQAAENCADSLTKGMGVIIIGTPVMKEWEAKDGTKRHKLELNADHVAVSLNRYSVKATKTTNSGSATQTFNDDPWATNQKEDIPF